MELELGRLVVGRLARNPWLGVAALGLLVLPWLLRLVGPLGIQPQLVDSQILIAETAFLWGLLGGCAGLGVLGSIEPWLERTGRGRHWRARVVVLTVAIVGPMPLAFLHRLYLPSGLDPGSTWAPIAWRLAFLIAVACLVDAARVPTVRSIAFLSLAWWLPALVPAVFGVALLSTESSLPELARSGTSAGGSTASLAGFAPILALGLLATGIDLLRRRSA